ncbi:MAG: ABC transporter ATP-binding protein [bacterium]|nr:ABC transporter ATP-binding protein [bacterium]
MTRLLNIQHLEAWYGPAQALFGVDLDVAAGEVVALMGRNGMGKTTTIRALCGLMRPCRGTVLLEEQDVLGAQPHHIARSGIGLVPEGRRCFANLTVHENLVVAARRGAWDMPRILELFPALEPHLSRDASTLSGGEQQMLAIGRALMTNPKLLVMDEATEGLAPTVRRDIWRAIAILKGTGQSILLVDKVVGDLLANATRCVILEKGRTAWRGSPTELDDATLHRYLGV